jgi:hypothetical protein
MAYAIGHAASTWDDASSQNLFADTDTVVIDGSKIVDKYDGYSVHAWKPISGSGILGTARTWYSTRRVNGYYPILESDISYNSKYQWSTTGGAGIDIETVALHELGHMLGLGDLYLKYKFSKDTRQIMHRYTGVKRTLGNGDLTGIGLLYG